MTQLRVNMNGQPWLPFNRSEVRLKGNNSIWKWTILLTDLFKKSSLILFFIFNVSELSVNRKDFQASTLGGLTWENHAQDPLAAQD